MTNNPNRSARRAEERAARRRAKKYGFPLGDVSSLVLVERKIRKGTITNKDIEETRKRSA